LNLKQFINWLLNSFNVQLIFEYVAEVLFIAMKNEKLSKQTNIFWHTCKRKFECILESLLLFSAVAQIYILQ
jgi:hypothetical protein